MLKSRLRFASKIGGWHLLVSFILACLIATLVFFVWYPYPLREVTGSFGLFWLLIGVDVICGPLITFILANPKKSQREMSVDLSLVAVIQLSAMLYGMYHVYQSRPVVVAFEVDRLRVLSPPDIAQEELPWAPANYRKLPLFKQLKVATRDAKDGDDRLNAIEKSLSGYDLGQRPSWWIPYESGIEKIKKRAKPVKQLQTQLDQSEKIKLTRAIKKIKTDADKELFYLPLTSPRSNEWIGLLDKNMKFVGAAPIDGFKRRSP